MSARGGLAAALLATLVVLGCTVDQLVGQTDGGSSGPRVCADTCTCAGSGSSCDFVCGAQFCQLACAEISDCRGSCDGGICDFHCEATPGCNPTCSTGPCTTNCTRPTPETISCTLSCTPTQDCAIDCRENTCTMACGALRPATACDAGFYTCSADCP